MIFWISKAAGFGTSWADIVKNGFLTKEGQNLHRALRRRGSIEPDLRRR
ncbi:MAG: hypothetical protein ACOYOF_15185 [Verrucomicrobiaceae bacterium]